MGGSPNAYEKARPKHNRLKNARTGDRNRRPSGLRTKYGDIGTKNEIINEDVSVGCVTR
jgi:hypothetical protein